MNKPRQKIRKPIHRIAVCFAGQWRTTDSLIEYTRDWFKECGCNIDFYMYTKSYTTKAGSDEVVWLDEDAIQERVQGVLGDDLEDLVIVDEPTRYENGFNAVFHNINNVLHMKSMGERRKKIVYDLVWVMRPDILLNIPNYHTKFIQWLNRGNWGDVLETENAHDTVFMKQFVGTTSGSIASEYDDSIMCGSSAAMDKLAYGMGTYLNSSGIENNKINPRTWRTNSIHNILPYCVKDSNLIRIDYPTLLCIKGKHNKPLLYSFVREDSFYNNKNNITYKNLEKDFFPI